MFTLKYKEDPGLEFLRFCSHEEIKSLADILIKTGGTSEEISSNDEFIKNKENLMKCWPLVAAELQKFGGNSISNVARLGEGVVYEEIVNDACESLDIKSNNILLTEKEDAVLLKTLDESISTMNAVKIFNYKAKESAREVNNLKTFKDCMSLEPFMAYEVALGFFKEIINFAETHESKKRTPRPLYKPSGDIITSVLTSLVGMTFVYGTNQADPAFRVTIPAIIQVGFLRRGIMNKNIL